MRLTVIPVVVVRLEWSPRAWKKDWRKPDEEPWPSSIIQISKNILKSPGNLNRLTVTQNQVKEQQQRLVWKTRMKWNNNSNDNNNLWSMIAPMMPMLPNIWSPWNSLQKLGKKNGRIENQRKNRDHPDHSIERTCCHSVSSKRPPTNAGVKKSPGVKWL